MGGISSSQIASCLGLAASHYRMIEAGSAILQPARAIKVIQTFDAFEFVPLCQVLVSIQVLDSAKDSIPDMRTTAELLAEANPPMRKILGGLGGIWERLEHDSVAEIARKLVIAGVDKEMDRFLTTEPVNLSAEEIDNFMTPTYEHPISGQLYSKIGNILQGVAPFYLDTVLQLIDNLRNITPRVTPGELARWEASHKGRISYIIGIVGKPEIIVDVGTFDYSFLWQENFREMFIIHRDRPIETGESVKHRITRCLKQRYESERVKYERQLDNFDVIVDSKLTIVSGADSTEQIDRLLLHRDVRMNNLWFYIMNSGYVVPFIDDATVGAETSGLYGTSLAYDETCEKLVDLRKLCRDAGFEL